MAGENILWGREYFFLRDEFHNAKPHIFVEKIDSLLITFGGTDQNDLTRKILNKVTDYCLENKIKIFVVVGSGYLGFEELKKEFDKLGKASIEITHATGVISRIMEKTPIAIASNGRTVYELAHMNIPSIVVPVNEREKTHEFACVENGFIPVNKFQEGFTPDEVFSSLRKLLENRGLRKQLFENVKLFDFNKSKSIVLQKIVDVLTD